MGERSGWWAGFRAECLVCRLVGSWVDGWVKGWESKVVGFGWSGPQLERAIPRAIERANMLLGRLHLHLTDSLMAAYPQIDAEGLAADSVAVVWRRFQLGLPEWPRLRAYGYGVAHRLVRLTFRSRVRQRLEFLQHDDLDESAASTEGIGLVEVLFDLNTTLKSRDVLVLHLLLAGMGCGDIAQVLGVSCRTVRSAFTRIRSRVGEE